MKFICFCSVIFDRLLLDTLRTRVVQVHPLNPLEDALNVVPLVYGLVARLPAPRVEDVAVLGEDEVKLVAGLDLDAVGRVGPLVEVETQLQGVCSQIQP